MSWRILTRSLLVAAVLLAGARAVADDIRKEMKGEVSEAAKSAEQGIENLRVLKLTVKDVDRAQHKVTFEAEISPEAKFTRGESEPIRMDELRAGDEVQAAFDPATGDVVAVKVQPSSAHSPKDSGTATGQEGTGSAMPPPAESGTTTPPPGDTK